MADHVRKQLRTAVTAALVAAVMPSVGARVYPSRVYPADDDNLPCVLVYATSEANEVETLDGDFEQRSISIRVEGLAKVALNLDDVLDQIAKEVEDVLDGPLTVGAFTTQLQYLGSEITMRADLETPCGSVALVFEAVLHTSQADTIVGA